MMRRGHRVAAGLGLLVGLAVIGAGCGSGMSESDGTTTTEPPLVDASTTTTGATTGASFSVLAGEGVPVDLDELAANLDDRLAAAGYADATVDVAGDRVTVTPGDGPLDQATLEDLVSTPGRLEIRPVLAVGGTDCEVTVPTGGNEEAVHPELDDRGAVVACYSLAPTGLTNDGIEDAAATFPDANWVVNPIFTTAGIEAFNDLAATCVDHAATCPTGQVAIAMDGVVLAAPTVNQPEFERDVIQISGDFTESEAKALAASLRVEPLPGGLEVVD